MSATVRRTLYPHSDRGERRRIGRELAGLKENALQIGQLRKVLEERGLAHLLPESAPKPPLRLLACGHCGYPTPRCICTDANGKRLDWGLGAAR